MVTLNHFQNFIHQVCITISASSKISWNFVTRKKFWNTNQDVAFKKTLDFVTEIKNLYQYKQAKKIRVKCNASHSGRGACLEQETEPASWVPIFFASRSLNSAELKSSTNKLELLV